MMILAPANLQSPLSQFLMNTNVRRRSHGTLERGFSIVELMVALTVGLLLLAGLTGIFVSNNRTHDEMMRANRQIANGQYAMEVITGDLRNAGYLAEFDPTPLIAPTTLPNVCDTAVVNLKTAIPVHIQGTDDGAGLPTCISDVHAATDVLAIRRVSTCVAGAVNCDAIVAGYPYFQASLCGGATQLGSTNPLNYYALDTNIAALTRTKRNCATLADLHRYETHIYFIANNDKAGDGIPTLKVAELTNGAFTTSSLVEGIENMQLEYGLDTSGDGIPNVFTTDPNTYNGCSSTTNPTCVGNWQNAVAVKIHVLARNTSQSPDVPDNKTYTLGLNAAGAANTVGPYNDRYKRHVFESSIKLYNPAGRRGS